MTAIKQVVNSIPIAGRFVSLAEVLRGLDKARRELAVHLVGADGAFTGFTSLRIDESALALADATEILLSVVALEVLDSSARMEFHAHARRPTVGGFDTLSIVSGRGVTIYPRVTSDPCSSNATDALLSPRTAQRVRNSVDQDDAGCDHSAADRSQLPNVDAETMCSV